MARRSKKRSLKIPNLADVETKGFVIPEGDYKLRVADIETGEGASGTYYKWTFEISGGQFDGKRPKPEYTSLAKESLWKLRETLEYLGVDIPDGPFELDFDDVIGKECMGSIDHETYEGRIQSKISNLAPLTDDDEDEEEDEKPKKAAKKSSKKADDDEDDEEEAPKAKRGRKSKKPVDEDEDEDEEDEPPAKKSKKPVDDDDEDEDEEDEKPKSKKAAKKAKKSKPTQADIQAMSQDELEEFIEEHELEVDLSDYATIRKMRAAVIDAATEAEVIDED